ncbi:MAG: HlyD family efflux transporter periplasmic adaptor subunit [Crocinitomicaceae bacterium]
MKLRHIIIIVVFLIINVLIIMALKGGKQKTVEKDKSEVFIQTLPAVQVQNKEEHFNVEGYGTVTSFNSTDVSCEVQGKLIAGNKPLKPGVKFSKGELLFRVNDNEARYNLRSRKSGFINIIAQMMPEIKVDFPDEFEKWNDYMNDIKLNESLPQLPAWKNSKEKVFLSTRNVLTEYFAIKSLEEQLAKFSVYAPYNGMITEVFINDHSVVNPGTKIMKIIQTGNFEVPVSIPASSLDAINIGTKTEIYSTSGELKGMGSVVRISEVINKSTQSVDVYIKPVAIEGHKFIEGEYVKVAIDESGKYEGIRIPVSAVHDNSVLIYSKKDSTLSIKPVMILNKNEFGVFVSGLNDNEIVIAKDVPGYTDSTKYDVLIK